MLIVKDRQIGLLLSIYCVIGQHQIDCVVFYCGGRNLSEAGARHKEFKVITNYTIHYKLKQSKNVTNVTKLFSGVQFLDSWQTKLSMRNFISLWIRCLGGQHSL